MLRAALALALTLATAASAAHSLGAPRELAMQPELVHLDADARAQLDALCVELEATAAKTRVRGSPTKRDVRIGARAPSSAERVCEIFVIEGELVVVAGKYAFAAFDPINRRDPFGLKLRPIQDPRLASIVETIRQSPTGAQVLEAVEASPIEFELVPATLPHLIFGLTGNDPENGITDSEDPTGGETGQGFVKIRVDVQKADKFMNGPVDALKGMATDAEKKPEGEKLTQREANAVIAAVREFRAGARQSPLYTAAHELGHAADFKFDEGQEEDPLHRLAAQIVGELDRMRSGHDPHTPSSHDRTPYDRDSPGPRTIYVPPAIPLSFPDDKAKRSSLPLSGGAPTPPKHSFAGSGPAR